jgi:hypothetical protein
MIEESNNNQGQQGTQQPQGPLAEPPLTAPSVPVVPPLEPTVAAPDTANGSPPDRQGTYNVQAADELRLFERETLRLSQEALEVSRNTARLTIWGVVIAAISGFFFYAQLSYLKDQTVILANQAMSDSAGASLSAVQVQKQIAIGQQQADAAQNSVKAITRQMRQDQRPWIRFDMGDPVGPPVTWRMKVGGPLNVPTRFTNVGKTPAEAVRVYAVIEVVANGKEPDVPKDFSPVWTKKAVATAVVQVDAGAIFPSSHMDQTITRVIIGEHGQAAVRNLSVAEANDLLNKRAYWAVYGKVEYADVFGFKHWTRFCKDGYADGEDANSSKCAHYYAVDNN